MATEPANDTQLYERLREMFGIGDYDSFGSQPYHEYVRGEVAKLKAWRNKRSIGIQALWFAAEYCQANHIPITKPYELSKHTREGWRWHRDKELEAAAARAEERVNEAVSRERTLAQPDPAWLSRLLTAAPEYREGVLVEWEKSYSSRLADQSKSATA